MKALVAPLALLLLSPAAAFAANELICDPDARVTFDTSWIGTASVTLNAETSSKLPRTGREPLTSGSEMRTLALSAGAPEELQTVPDDTVFVTYRPHNENSSLPSTSLYLDRNLLDGSEQDGLVVAETRAPTADAAGLSQFHVYHCRRR